MYEYLKGVFVEKRPMFAVIEVSGIGYGIRTPLTFTAPESGSEIIVFCKQIVKEDLHEFFGFNSAFDRGLFCLLISVSGVGASTAILIMSHMDSGAIISAIHNMDSEAFKRVKGVGEKTSKQIILDLSKKVSASFGEVASGSNSHSHKSADYAAEALVSLGFGKAEASKKVSAAIAILPNDVSVEELIKACLSG